MLKRPNELPFRVLNFYCIHLLSVFVVIFIPEKLLGINGLHYLISSQKTDIHVWEN